MFMQLAKMLFFVIFFMLFNCTASAEAKVETLLPNQTVTGGEDRKDYKFVASEGEVHITLTGDVIGYAEPLVPTQLDEILGSAPQEKCPANNIGTCRELGLTYISGVMGSLEKHCTFTVPEGTTVCVRVFGSSSGYELTASFQRSSIAPQTYRLITHTLGDGSIIINPNKTNYDENETVTFTAKPNGCNEFSGWQGGCAGTTSSSCTLTMNSNQEVTAQFQIKRFQLSISTEYGTVTPSIAGDQHDCGTQLTLTAQPDTGYRFGHWDNGDTSPSLSLTINSDKQVIATFEPLSYERFTVLIRPPDSGTVSLSPDKAAYTHGEIINLNAAPDSCYDFDRWQGACAGETGDNCVLTIDGPNQTVEALFSIKTMLLTASAENGQIMLLPRGGSYDCGTQVQLLAISENQYQFTQWQGDMSGTQAVNSLIMDSDKTVTTIFSGTIDYTYDELHRLVQATYPTGQTIMYRYDPAGNILSATETALPPSSPTDGQRAMDQVEAKYAELLPAQGKRELKLEGYEIRYYPMTDAYLGYNHQDQGLYGLGPAWGNSFVPLGTLSDFLP
jgi:YD repeat-containing protein